MEKSWYILYTNAGAENKVIHTLRRKKVENFFPLTKLTSSTGFRRKIVSKALFSSYVFVKSNQNEVMNLKKIDGVINVVYWQKNPAIIPSFEIEIIKKFLNEYQDVVAQKGIVNLNEEAAIETNPQIEKEGNVFSVSKNIVKGYLPTLGYHLVAKANKVTVELFDQHPLLKTDLIIK